MPLSRETLTSTMSHPMLESFCTSPPSLRRSSSSSTVSWSSEISTPVTSKVGDIVTFPEGKSFTEVLYSSDFDQQGIAPSLLSLGAESQESPECPQEDEALRNLQNGEATPRKRVVLPTPTKFEFSGHQIFQDAAASCPTALNTTHYGGPSSSPTPFPGDLEPWTPDQAFSDPFTPGLVPFPRFRSPRGAALDALQRIIPTSIPEADPAELAAFLSSSSPASLAPNSPLSKCHSPASPTPQRRRVKRTKRSGPVKCETGNFEKYPPVISSMQNQFVCERCGQRFRRMEHLRRHDRKHTGEKPYVCKAPQCNRAFARTDNLRTHHKTHMKKPGEGGRNPYVPGLRV